jgi:hypothetical protein
MKKLNVFFAVLVCSLVFSIGAKAQASGDFFIGKWNVLTTGLPSGDAKSIVTFERKDGKLIGTMAEEKKPNVNVFRKVEEKENSVTGYFTASGYDVYIYLEKKDDNNVSGSLMDMFDCTGVRIVETKTEAK